MGIIFYCLNIFFCSLRPELKQFDLLTNQFISGLIGCIYCEHQVFFVGNNLKEYFQGIHIIYIFRALKDAEKAISLADKWPKGYFRKGRALAGLRVRFYHPVER